MSALADLLAATGPAPRRYDIVQRDDVTHYGPWRIYYDPPPIPSRNCDWHWFHDDFDGADDARDGRCGHEPSFAGCLYACDEWEDDNSPAAAARKTGGEA